MSVWDSKYLPRDLDIDEILKKARSENASSDVTGRSLYNKYASQAAMDAVGKATARTGGYGNSYALTAGKQAYESMMSKANSQTSGNFDNALTEYYNKYISSLTGGTPEADTGDNSDPETEAVKAFRESLSPESAHDAIARQMYGTYAGYVATMLEENTTLTDDEKRYLIGLYNITDTDIIYSENAYKNGKRTEPKSLKDRSWKVLNGGGVNWGWGVDNNAEYEDQYGNTYKASDLVDALIEDGMTKDEAREYVIGLQDLAVGERSAEVEVIDQNYKMGLRNLLGTSTASATKLDATAVNSWFESVSAVANRAYDYLTTDGYKQPDADLLEEIDGYLAGQEEIGHFLRANKSSIKNYDELYQAYVDTVVALKSLRNSLQASNRVYSQWGSEEEYNTWYGEYQTAKHEQERYFEMANSEQGQLGWEKYLADVNAEKDAEAKAKDEMPLWERLLGYLGTSGATDTSLPLGSMPQIIRDIREDESYKKPQADWSEEQQRVFGYLYLENPSDAIAYAITTNEYNKQVSEEKALMKISESATSSGWAMVGHTLASIVAAPIGGMSDFLYDLAVANAGKEIGASDGVVSPFEYSQAATGAIGVHLNNKYGTLDEDIPVVGGKGWGDVYGLGTSILQSAASGYTLGPVGTLVSYFGQGAAAAIDDAKRRGASDSQAVIYGIALGLFEGIAESIGIDRLFKLTSSTTIKELIKNILKQAGAEGMEEGLTSVMSNIADIFIMQDKSNFNSSLEKYLSDGMSESEAKWKVFWDSIEGIAYDTVGGAVSGGVHGGFHSAVQYAVYQSKVATHGQGIIDAGGTDALLTVSKEMKGENKVVDKYSAKVGKKASAGNVGRLALAMQDAVTGKGGKGSSGTKKTKSGKLNIQQIADVKTRVSESGKTVNTSTGEVLTIDKDNAIAEIRYEDGERVVYYNTDSGVVKSSDVVYASEDEGLIYESFVDLDPLFANAIIKNYDGNMPVENYIRGMREGVILYGMHNFQAVGKDIRSDTYFAELSKEDQAFALKLGRAYAEADAKEADSALENAAKKARESEADGEGASKSATVTKVAKKGKIRFENGAKAESKHKNVVALAKHLASALGIDIIFYDSTIPGTKYSNDNGFYDPNTDTIHLDLQKADSDKKTVAFTLSHELVHWLKEHSKTAFNSFAKFLMEQYASHGTDTEAMLQNKMTALNTEDADFAYEEMICDACETLLLDSNAVVKLAELRQTDKSLFDKIKSFIRNLLDRIRGKYTKLGYDNNLSDEAKALLSMTDVLSEIYAKFEEAVVTAAENADKTRGVGGIAASDTKAIKKQAKTKDSKIIDDVVPASNPYHSKTMYVDSEVYNYDFLTSLAPMKVETMPPLTAVKDNNKVSQDKAVRLGLANAEKIGRRVTADKEQYAIINSYTQREIILGRKGLNHSLDASEIHRLRTNARLSAIGAYIVQNAVPINGLKKENQQANGTYAMACLLNDGPGYVVAIVTVDEFDSTVVGIDVVDSVHSINGRFLAKKEDSRSSSRESELGQESVSATAISNISIADFLEIVNSTHRSILSNDVLQYFNAERPSNGHYANRVLFQKKTASSRSILASALESTIDTSTEAGKSELEKLKEYQSKIALIEQTEARLAEVKAEIHDISFTKGSDRSKLPKLNEEKIKLQNRLVTYDRQLARLEAMKPLQDLLKRERERSLKSERQKGKDALDAYRARMMEVQKEQIGQAREAKKTAVAKVRESRDRQEARKKLIKLVLETVSWITHPAKTDVRCPDMLKRPYKEFLDSINLDSQRALKGDALTKQDLRIDSAMNSLASAVERIRSEQVTEDGDIIGFLDLPENYVKILRDIAESIKDNMPAGYFVVNSMTSEELKQLIKLIGILNTSIKKMNALHANMRFENARELADTTISFLDSMGKKEKTNSLKDFVTWINALPYYAFKRFGEGGESIFEELMDAQDKMAYNAKTILDFKKKSWTDKEARAWGADTHTILLPSGASLTLTTADAMGIYCTARRDNGQGIGHLTGGGVRVIGLKKGTSKVQDSEANLTLADIDEIIDSLTDRQKEVAEAIQSFMSSVCADWGNEISMKRFLTKDFTEKIYYPIESADENLDAKLPEASQGDLYRLLNISATKSLTKGANNRIVIRNIFDVFTSHCSDMARLNAFGMALLDYMKWINYQERTVNAENGQVSTRGVRKSMNATYGDAARQYVMNLIKDINGRQSDDADNSFLMSMVRFGKTAAVGNNLRVAFLQFSSYPRAAMVLSKSSLAKGLTKAPKIRMAEKYCGIALWKTFGFYDTNIARSIEDQIKGATNIRQKIIELSMTMPGMADALTWGALWNACEYEVAKTSENKVGSEEFYQEVGKKLREVVYATQVVDSVLTRSQIMRSKRGVTQVATAYMSEPTLTANILMDAGFQFEKERRTTGSAKIAFKNTHRIIFKAVGNYCILQLLTSLFESLADAWRDDEDEEFEEKFKEAFKENAISNLIPFNKIPIIADIAELVQSRFGVGYVSSDNMSTTWLKHIADALDVWSEVIDEQRGGEETSKTVYNAIYATAKAISSVTGISVSGAMREVVALWNNTVGEYDITLKIRLYDLSNEELGNEFYEAIIEGNDRQAESIRAEFEDEDEMNAAIRKALRANDPRIAEAAQADIDGDITEYDRIVTEILAEGNFSEENIKRAIKAEINSLTGDEDESDTANKTQSIYDTSHYFTAITDGNTALAGKIKKDIIDTHIANGKDEEEAEKAFTSSFRTCLRDGYKDGELSRDQALNMLTEYGGMEADDAYWKLKEWDYFVANGSTDGYSKYNGFYEAVRTGSNLKTVIKEYTDHGVKTTTLASQITSYYKPLYRNMTNSERAKIKGYLLNAYSLLGYDRSEKSKDIDKWLED